MSLRRILMSGLAFLPSMGPTAGSRSSILLRATWPLGWTLSTAHGVRNLRLTHTLPSLSTRICCAARPYHASSRRSFASLPAEQAEEAPLGKSSRAPKSRRSKSPIGKPKSNSSKPPKNKISSSTKTSSKGGGGSGAGTPTGGKKKGRTAALLFDAIEEEIHSIGPATSQPLGPSLVLEDDAHPLRDHHFSRSTWTVLMRLRGGGHETYIVGGTVRDILLGRTPKDYDILTSAEPQQVAQLFPRAFVLGRSFPICHVHHDGEIIEVSSFSTNADPTKIPLDAAAANVGRDHRRQARALRRLDGKFRKGKKGGAVGGDFERDIDNGVVSTLADSSVSPLGEYSEDNSSSTNSMASNILSSGEISDSSSSNNGTGSSTVFNSTRGFHGREIRGPTWAAARRENASKRDFTANGLLYDPFSRLLYDYVGGVNDCTRKILRTLGPARDSFKQDPARILRAVRLAARVGLQIDSCTSTGIEETVPLVAGLPQGRLHMELGAMLTHGAARRSVELMWRFGLLDMLLPQHAVLLAKEKVPRDAFSDHSTTSQTLSSRSSRPSEVSLLFSLLSRLDRHAAPQSPIDTAVWVAALAAPLVARECRKSAERRAASINRRQRRDTLSSSSGSFDDGSGGSSSSSSGDDSADEQSFMNYSSTQDLLEEESVYASSSTSISANNCSTDVGTSLVHNGASPLPVGIFPQGNGLVDAHDSVAEEESSGALARGNGKISSARSATESSENLEEGEWDRHSKGSSSSSNGLQRDSNNDKEEEEESSPSAIYLVAYGKIVDKVMTRMLSPPDAKAQHVLAAAALPCFIENTSRESAMGGKKRRGRKKKPIGIVDIDENEDELPTAAITRGADAQDASSLRVSVPILPCVLPRQAVEMAREFLKIEAEMRGQDLPEPEAKEGKKKTRHRQRRRRRLGANEHLVLQLLRSPEVGWEKATYLGID